MSIPGKGEQPDAQSTAPCNQQMWTSRHQPPATNANITLEQENKGWQRRWHHLRTCFPYKKVPSWIVVRVLLLIEKALRADDFLTFIGVSLGAFWGTLLRKLDELSSPK